MHSSHGPQSFRHPATGWHGSHRLVPVRVRAEPDVVAAAGGELAAPEAVAAVRGERAAEIQAGVRLRLVELLAGAARPGGIRAQVVRAGRAVVRLGVVVRRDRVGIALVVPVAAVVARAGVLIEVAVDDACRPGVARDAAVIVPLGVVAGAEAVGILVIDEPVAVIVDDVAALVRLALAQGLHRGRAADAARVRAGARRPAGAHPARAAAADPGTRAHRAGPVDGIVTAADAQREAGHGDEQGERDGMDRAHGSSGRGSTE